MKDGSKLDDRYYGPYIGVLVGTGGGAQGTRLERDLPQEPASEDLSGVDVALAENKDSHSTVGGELALWRGMIYQHVIDATWQTDDRPANELSVEQRRDRHERRMARVSAILWIFGRAPFELSFEEVCAMADCDGDRVKAYVARLLGRGSPAPQRQHV